MKACARTAGSNVAAVSSRTASVFGDEEGDAQTPAQTESTTASNKRARERREGRAIVVCSVTAFGRRFSWTGQCRISKMTSDEHPRVTDRPVR